MPKGDRILRKGMSPREVTRILGPEWEDWPTRRGFRRIFEALDENDPELLVDCDCYFVGGKLTRWVGDVERIARIREEILAARRRGRAVAGVRGSYPPALKIM